MRSSRVRGTMAKTKKIIIPGITLLISAFISFLFLLGIGAGFLGTYLFQSKAPGGKMQLNFNLGKRRFHLHHWIMGSLFLLVIGIAGLLPFFPKFFIGGACGVIFHDLYMDKNWYRILIKK